MRLEEGSHQRDLLSERLRESVYSMAVVNEQITTIIGQSELRQVLSKLRFSLLMKQPMYIVSRDQENESVNK